MVATKTEACKFSKGAVHILLESFSATSADKVANNVGFWLVLL